MLLVSSLYWPSYICRLLLKYIRKIVLRYSTLWCAVVHCLSLSLILWFFGMQLESDLRYSTRLFVIPVQIGIHELFCLLNCFPFKLYRLPFSFFDSTKIETKNRSWTASSPIGIGCTHSVHYVPKNDKLPMVRQCHFLHGTTFSPFVFADATK